ncbi:hypothetical protein Q9K01_08810 [Qipengyuania sp. DY56-A-20]|jgi:hypothetical protein|uniref:PepSY domain-containing protein n=1 Tax=Qipengyuania benthica TaxID=3067651 RepID=A0ABT9H8S9_9SPHN|nr:hypothetical protein [Qipengyuania sp. DY56-A-20]MDP4539720.1 hypothetical protein [Qipengyuania sp. DY56-A-20]
MIRFARFAAAPAMLAALSLTASPAMAAELPASASRSAMAAELAWNAGEGQTYDQYRRYRHDRRYDHRYGRYDRGRVDAGDILTGVLILGGIAAIASAASRDNERETRYPDTRYPDTSYRGTEPTGLDRAAAMCVERIERDARVESVDSVDRDARGWRVTGRLYDGAGFSCAIDADGRIRAIDLGNGEAAYDDGYALGDGSEPYAIAPAEDRQYDDASYRAAWANVAAEPTLPATRNQPLPAYPGGPLPGDLEQDEIGSEYPGGY